LLAPIPDSKFYFRLWPGPVIKRHYYLDFVSTGDLTKPVNSPLEFFLWAVTPSIPTLPAHFMPLPSLEENMGMQRKDIPDGEERFVLIEGQQCVLRRPGLQDVGFEVPIRSAIVSPLQSVRLVQFS